MQPPRILYDSAALPFAVGQRVVVVRPLLAQWTGTPTSVGRLGTVEACWRTNQLDRQLIAPRHKVRVKLDGDTGAFITWAEDFACVGGAQP